MTEVMIVPLIIFHPMIYLEEPVPLKLRIRGETYRNVYRRLATLINERRFQLAELGDVVRFSPRTSFTYVKSEKDKSLFILYKYASQNLLLAEIDKLEVMPSDTTSAYSSSIVSLHGEVYPAEMPDDFATRTIHTPRLKALIISSPKEDAKDLCDMNASYLTMLTEDEIEAMYKWQDYK